MIKFKIKLKSGYFSEPEIICGKSYGPKYNATFQGASVYLTKSMAERTLDYFRLRGEPYYAEIQEFTEANKEFELGTF